MEVAKLGKGAGLKILFCRDPWVQIPPSTSCLRNSVCIERFPCKEQVGGLNPSVGLWARSSTEERRSSKPAAVGSNPIVPVKYKCYPIQVGGEQKSNVL